MHATSILISGSRRPPPFHLHGASFNTAREPRWRVALSRCLEATHFIYGPSVAPNHVRKPADCRACWSRAPIGSQSCTGAGFCRISSARAYLLWKETQPWRWRAWQLHGHVTCRFRSLWIVTTCVFVCFLPFSVHSLPEGWSPASVWIKPSVWIVVRDGSVTRWKSHWPVAPLPHLNASCWHDDELQSSIPLSLTALRSHCRQDRPYFVPNFTLKRNVRNVCLLYDL